MMHQAICYVPTSLEDWQEKRKEGIGGSEIAAIMGVSRYRSNTPYRVWLEKTGRKEPFQGNDRTKAGHYMEMAIAAYWEEETGMKVIKSSAEDKIYIHPDYPFLFGTPDRRYWDLSIDEDNKGILECKNTGMNIDVDSIPTEWFCQIQWYMGILGYKFGTLAWLYNGYDIRYKKIDFDKKFFDFMVQNAIEFWTKYIETDTAPPSMNGEDVEMMFQSHGMGKYLDVTDGVYTTYVRLKEVKAQIKELENEAESLADQLKLVIQDNEGLTYNGDKICTWKRCKDSVRFDAKTFQHDHPELYADYLVTKEGFRTLRLS